MEKIRLVVIVFSVSFIVSLISLPAFAQCSSNEQQVSIGFPGAVEKNGVYCVPINKDNPDVTQNPIWVLLRGIIQFLVAGVGVAVAGGIIYGGVLYMTARGNSAQTQKAVEVITHAAIGLLLFIFMFVILNFLIPGGILG